jgi:serine/threonine protein kinase
VSENDRTISVARGDIVEVVETSSNQWSLIRTMDMVPREGWIPSEFVELYDYTNHTLNGVRSSSFGARSSSTDGENYDFPQTSPLSPTLSNIGLTDEEEKKEAIEHRDFTLSELIDSEKQYIDRLDFCLRSYKLAIDENNATIPKSLKASSNELFGNIQEIYDFHKREILPQLEGCRDNLSDLADLFALSAQQMKALYVTYCQGKHRSEDVYNEHIEYLEDIREKLRDRLCLRDYLILPVQRITKYNLLLKSINEDSCKAGEAIPYFESALAASKEISVQANNVVHMSMIEGIDRRLNEFGELVLQDSFGVCDRQKALYKERRVFLFTNVLVITKKKIDTAEREMYINKETLMLLEVTFSEDTDVEKRNIIIYDISTGNKFVLKTLHMSVRDEWMGKAQELINIARRATVGPSRTRSVSEPVDYGTSNKQLNPSISHGLLRNGSQRSRRARSRPSSASRERKPPQAGTKYVVMECVVLEGGDDCQLEPKEIVELVRVEASGMLRVRTSDGIEGTIPPGFVRRMDDVSEGAMETAPRITVAPVDQTLFISENFSVSCAFNGLPPPNVVWKRDDVVINPEGGKAKISSCATSSVLEVYNVDYHNEGQYSCTVTNGLGNATAEMDLFIHGPPSKPSKPTVSKQSLTSVKLKWSQPEYNGHSIISSYLVEQLQEGLDDWMVIVQQLKTSFVVKTLNVNTWYQFRIIANNEHGSSNPGPPSDRVFTTKTPKVMSATDDRKVYENESGEMLIASVGGLVKALHPILDVPDVTNIRYDSINSYYNVLPGEVGRGQFGIVKKCTCKHDNSLVAAKFLNHSSEAMREVTILQKLPSSPHIMEFVDAFITDGETLVLVTELLNGGELIDWILIDDSPLTEGLVANYVHQLLLAIEFIHNRNIIHLDIKPENLLITTIPQPTLKLIDFGSAQELDDSADLSIKPDSIEFCALEIVFNDSSNINKFTDMWSVGVIAYVLLSGLSPFYIDNSTTMYHKLANVQLDWSPSPFPYLSSHVQNFISSLLKKNTNDRLSVVMAIQHPWIKDNMTQECTTPIDTTLLKDFQVRRKLQTSAKSIKMTSIFDTPGSPLHDDMNYECPPNFDEGTERIQAPVGAAITLEWNYSGHPQPVVEWEHNERMLVPSDHVTIINDMRSTRVFIDGVIRPDEGVYSCYISNPHGTDIQYCHLIVFDVPSAPSDVTCVPLGPSLLVSWLPSVNDGNSPLTHYVLQVGQEGHDEWETLRDDLMGAAHVVEGLPTGQSYLFRVASGNAIGLSPFSKPSHPILMSTSDDTCTSSESSAVSDVKKMHFSEDFNMEYELGAEIGRGLFSVVYKCTQNVTDRSFAAKFIPLNGNNYEMASREFELLKELKHTRIAMMEEAFTTPTHMILILEL